MTKEKQRPSAEDVLDNLAKVLSESNEDGEFEATPDESVFLEKAMDLVGHWQNQWMMAEATEKKNRFEAFLQPVLQSIEEARKAGQTLVSTGLDSRLGLAPASAHFRKLETLTKSDLEGIALEEELLRLYLEMNENKGE